MPQIDFGKAFANDDDAASRAEPLFQPPASPPVQEVEPSHLRRTRLGRSDWTNIIFVLIAVLGGLFLAFYLFNGADVLRSAAAWPREFLYSRPFAPLTDSRVDVAQPAVAAVPEIPAVGEQSASTPRSVSALNNAFTGTQSTPLLASNPAAPLIANPPTIAPIIPVVPTVPVVPPAVPGEKSLTEAIDRTVAEAEANTSETVQQSVAASKTVLHTTKQKLASARRMTNKASANSKRIVQNGATIRSGGETFKVDPRLHVDTSPVTGTIGGAGVRGSVSGSSVGSGFGGGPGGSVGAGLGASPGSALGGGIVRTLGSGPLGLFGRH